MSLIGKTAFNVAYIEGDFMYPFFKWAFMTILVSSIAFCSYAFFVVDPKFSTVETPDIWINFSLWIAYYLKSYWWSWIVIPLMSSFVTAFVFAGICLELTRWFIRMTIGQWFESTS